MYLFYMFSKNLEKIAKKTLPLSGTLKLFTSFLVRKLNILIFIYQQKYYNSEIKKKSRRYILFSFLNITELGIQQSQKCLVQTCMDIKYNKHICGCNMDFLNIAIYFEKLKCYFE